MHRSGIKSRKHEETVKFGALKCPLLQARSLVGLGSEMAKFLILVWITRIPCWDLVLKMDQGNTIDLEQGWDFMLKRITKLKNIVEGKPDNSLEDYTN